MEDWDGMHYGVEPPKLLVARCGMSRSTEPPVGRTQNREVIFPLPTCLVPHPGCFLRAMLNKRQRNEAGKAARTSEATSCSSLLSNHKDTNVTNINAKGIWTVLVVWGKSTTCWTQCSSTSNLQRDQKTRKICILNIASEGKRDDIGSSASQPEFPDRLYA